MYVHIIYVYMYVYVHAKFNVIIIETYLTLTERISQHIVVMVSAMLNVFNCNLQVNLDI